MHELLPDGGIVRKLWAGEVDPPRSTPLSLMREAVVDGHSIVSAILEVQWRLLFRPA